MPSHTQINIVMCHTDSSWLKERDIHMFKPFMIYIVLKMFFIVSFVLFKLSLILFQSLIHSEEVNYNSLDFFRKCGHSLLTLKSLISSLIPLDENFQEGTYLHYSALLGLRITEIRFDTSFLN